MSRNLSKRLLQRLLPEGSVWTLEDGGGFDQLLDGMSDSLEDDRSFLDTLAYLRDPELTTLFEDLEKEYGLQENSKLSEAVRKKRLTAARTNRSGFGADYMQEKLHEYGFELNVFPNDPPINPNLFLYRSGPVCVSDNSFCCGNELTVCTGIGRDAVGDLIVNDDLYIESLISPPVDDRYDVDRELVEYGVPENETWAVVCGGPYVCGAENEEPRTENVPLNLAVCGSRLQLSAYWSLVFFVADSVDRDPVTNEITEVYPADIEESRRSELRRLIVKLKPMHSWCALVVNYI